MTTLELQANRQSLINKILEIEDPHIIERLRKYLNQLRPNQGESPAASISDMREAIERSEKDISLGHLSSHEEVMNRIHTKIALTKR
ncbi:MAG: hypothetical protein PHC95_03180 [Parabacteroides sp.]|nr:hypothetical protein [Parabacteroides sp.]